jgi:hypothetical protein
MFGTWALRLTRVPMASIKNVSQTTIPIMTMRFHDINNVYRLE